MATYAIADGNGVIVNRIVLDDVTAWTPPEGCSIHQEVDTLYEIGGTFVGGVYTPLPAPPAPPPPVPQSISDRQFFQQLAILGIITQDEALASNAAVIPPPLLAIIDAMPADQQFGARMIVSGATVFNRMDPLTIQIGTAYGWTSAQVDAFFQAAAAL